MLLQRMSFEQELRLNNFEVKNLLKNYYPQRLDQEIIEDITRCSKKGKYCSITDDWEVQNLS